MNLLAKQHGAAIIVALFITAIVAAIAVAMMDYLRVDIRRTELFLHNQQANLYAHGSLYWAKDQLLNNLKKKQVNQLIDLIPIHSAISIEKGYNIQSLITDEQAKLNLNNLNDLEYQKIFIRLIRIIAPTMTQADAEHIMLAAFDWISPNNKNSQFDEYYIKQNPPYRAPHRPMVSVSELRMIRGMHADLFVKLLPYITALPEKTAININTAPIQLIMSFHPNISFEMVKALDQYRHATPFVNLENLARFPVIKNSPIANSLAVKSQYFLVETVVIFQDETLKLYTLFLRLLKNGKPEILMLWQSKGTL